MALNATSVGVGRRNKRFFLMCSRNCVLITIVTIIIIIISFIIIIIVFDVALVAVMRRCFEIAKWQ